MRIPTALRVYNITNYQRRRLVPSSLTLPFRLAKEVQLGAAPGGGEYFDYLSVDADSFSEVGTISGLKRCHGVALVPKLGNRFITGPDATAVVMFDTKRLKVTGEIKNFR